MGGSTWRGMGAVTRDTGHYVTPDTGYQPPEARKPNKMQDNTIQDNTMQGNPDGFETIQKMGNDQEKSGQFLHNSENGKWSGKIRKVVKLFGKLEMIWKNLVCFETIRIMGNDLEKSIQSGFFYYSQKNPAEPKKFRVAMLPC